MALLTGDQILAADDMPYEDVPVPEWGGEVRVRRLLAAEWWKLTESAKSFGVHTDLQFCATVMIGEDGKQLFTAEQAAELAKKSWPALERVYDVARRLSGFDREEVKGIEKNS